MPYLEGMHRPAAEIVAIILAVSVGTALLVMTVPILWAVVHHDVEPARLVAITQVLTGWGGGMLGVLGAYVGYAFGKKPPE